MKSSSSSKKKRTRQSGVWIPLTPAMLERLERLAGDEDVPIDSAVRHLIRVGLRVRAELETGRRLRRALAKRIAPGLSWRGGVARA